MHLLLIHLLSHNVHFQGRLDENLPSIVMGIIAIACSFAIFFTPETKGQALPDTIAEIEIEAKLRWSKGK